MGRISSSAQACGMIHSIARKPARRDRHPLAKARRAAYRGLVLTMAGRPPPLLPSCFFPPLRIQSRRLARSASIPLCTRARARFTTWHESLARCRATLLSRDAVSNVGKSERRAQASAASHLVVTYRTRLQHPRWRRLCKVPRRTAEPRPSCVRRFPVADCRPPPRLDTLPPFEGIGSQFRKPDKLRQDRSVDRSGLFLFSHRGA